MSKTKNIVIAILGACLIFLLIIVAFLMGRSMPSRQVVADINVKGERPFIDAKTQIKGIANKQKTTKTITEIAKEQGPATVFIATYSKIGLDIGLGSGFIVSRDGKIVTNFHVIDNAYSASVKLTNGEVYDDISVIDYDERRDIAVIKVKGLNLPVTTISESNEATIGEKIVVIGNPAGLENSVSDGIVSATRDMEGYKLLQITAPISSGSSGGPVYDTKGEVIGIATSTIQQAQNINFAVPIEYVKSLLDKNEAIPLRDFQSNYEKKKWIGGKFDIAKKKIFSQETEESLGYLGIAYDPTQPESVRKIWKFRKYSPARDAGLKIGDQIIAIDDFIFEGKSDEGIEKFDMGKKEGDEAVFKILRNKEKKEIKIKYEKWPKPTWVPYAINEALMFGKVRLAIMVDEINYLGENISATQLDEWKRAERRDLINNCRQILENTFGNNKNFSIADTGKIDITLNDFENRHGVFSPQVRNNILESFGVTHLVELSDTRYVEKEWLGGNWRYKTTNRITWNLIDLLFEEVVCVDNYIAVKGFYEDRGKMDLVDPEDQESLSISRERAKLIEKEAKKHKDGN